MIALNLYGIPVMLADIIALLWFIGLWACYSYYADYRRTGGVNALVKVMYQHRMNWMFEMLKRDNRMVDAKVASNVMGSVTFFTSTTIFLLAGLLTMLTKASEGLNILTQLPFVTTTSVVVWEAKVIVLMVVFIYAFFKFTWAMRQFNYTSILIAGAPVIATKTALAKKHAERITKILSLAASNFNNGLRGYYFGLAALSWFLHPLIFMAATAWVVHVLFRREIRSKTLKILREQIL
jgi:uncharacterized membrane protein